MLVVLQLYYSSADCLHLQLYKDLKERQRNGQTKASLSLQQYLGFEAGFTLDKESNTLAILCEDVVPVLAFDTREILIQWRVKVSTRLYDKHTFFFKRKSKRLLIPLKERIFLWYCRCPWASMNT
ncbi:Protein Dok-7 [Papilio machaon]|uniref:Protein Dok-7 n=1 Tax=Papilio machaon TaxID=76193 RepID=A0A0N0PG19_PAPMA|nr:Protein Dok-7 [Papilio machaon]